MTTMTITPAEVTMEMLVAGVESNETHGHYPARYQLVNDEIRYSVKWSDGWEWVCTIGFEEIAAWMADDSGDDTIWTTPIQKTPHD